MEQAFRRYEFKYILDRNTAWAIRAMLFAHGMEHDPSAKRHLSQNYAVTSLYFDSPTMGDYSDKAGGFLQRKKIRTRIYEPRLTENTKEIWLEKKSKHEMLISKIRAPLTHQEYARIIHGDFLETVKNHPVFLPLMAQSMRPVAIVRYVREPLVYPHQQNLRITFDSHIETCKSRDLENQCFMQPVTRGETIMEVKFSHALPYWFRKIQGEFHISRSAFSKYGRSIESLYRYHPIPR